MNDEEVSATAAAMSDEQLAAALKERVRLLNAWMFAARNRGLHVRINWDDAPARSGIEKLPIIRAHVTRPL